VADGNADLAAEKNDVALFINTDLSSVSSLMRESLLVLCCGFRLLVAFSRFCVRTKLRLSPIILSEVTSLKLIVLRLFHHSSYPILPLHKEAVSR
jgi:hypothetical protein